jgi:hypothetical protein
LIDCGQIDWLWRGELDDLRMGMNGEDKEIQKWEPIEGASNEHPVGGRTLKMPGLIKQGHWRRKGQRQRREYEIYNILYLCIQ